MVGIKRQYLRAVAVGSVALAYAGRGVGFASTEPRWAIGDAVFAAALLVVAAAVAKGARSVRFLAVGLVGAAVFQWIALVGRLLLVADLPAVGEVWLASSSAFAIACSVVVLTCWTWPEVGSRRHPVALVLAGAALTGALRFAAAPGLPPLTSALALVGSVGLVVGTLGIGSGRTWGLLLLLPSALLIWLGVDGAPDIIVHHASHPWFPGAGFMKIRNAGTSSVALAVITVALYAVPMVRYLRTSGYTPHR